MGRGCAQVRVVEDAVRLWRHIAERGDGLAGGGLLILGRKAHTRVGAGIVREEVPVVALNPLPVIATQVEAVNSSKPAPYCGWATVHGQLFPSSKGGVLGLMKKKNTMVCMHEQKEDTGGTSTAVYQGAPVGAGGDHCCHRHVGVARCDQELALGLADAHARLLAAHEALPGATGAGSFAGLHLGQEV